MKIVSFETREDERKDFENIESELGIEIKYIEETLNDKTVEIVKGYEGVTILGHSKITSSILDRLNEYGVKYISTRTVGYNHIDIEYAKKLGVKISNSNYAPNGVADYTVMLILMSIRKYKQALYRGNVNDYSIEGLQGKEMRDLTIGVMGTGKIGLAVIDNLQGFGCKILAYDVYKNNKLENKAEYVDLDTFYEKSDIITLHMPLLNDTYHMIDKVALSKMKDGVVLINCARGELMDIEDMIKGIETQKIGALGLDVIENEEGIYHKDRRSDIIANREMAYLRQFPNVTMTQHIAFYTDCAVRSMVRCGVDSLVSFIKSGTSENEILR